MSKERLTRRTPGPKKNFTYTLSEEVAKMIADKADGSYGTKSQVVELACREYCKEA